MIMGMVAKAQQNSAKAQRAKERREARTGLKHEPDVYCDDYADDDSGVEIVGSSTRGLDTKKRKVDQCYEIEL